MGNTCKPLAVSFQCMTKSTTNKKKKKKKGQYNYINPNHLVHSDFTGTEINGKYLEIAHIQRCILLFHRPYDQISKYFKHQDVVTMILTNTTEMTLNEETTDAKRASVLFPEK